MYKKSQGVTYIVKTYFSIVRKNGADTILKWLIFIGVIFFALFYLYIYKSLGTVYEQFDIDKQSFHSSLIYGLPGVLLFYHFVPVVRSHLNIIYPYHPVKPIKRVMVNYLVNNLRLSNLLVLFLVFCLSIFREPFKVSYLINGSLNVFWLSLCIYLIKELLNNQFKFSYKRFFIFSSLLTCSAAIHFFYLASEYSLSVLLLTFSFMVLISAVWFLESFKTITGNSKSNTFLKGNFSAALIRYAYLNKDLFLKWRMMLLLDIVALFFYEFYPSSFIQSVLFYLFLSPLALMTNYGNNVFGVNNKVGLVIFSRPNSSVFYIKQYLKLLLLPLALFSFVSILFFFLYSDEFLRDILIFFINTVCIVFLGFILSVNEIVVLKSFSSRKISEIASYKSLILSVTFVAILIFVSQLNLMFYLIFSSVSILAISYCLAKNFKEFNSKKRIEIIQKIAKKR